MPRPLSNVYGSTELDVQALPREAVLERLTPQALLNRTKEFVLGNWEQAIPTDFMGKPLGHGGAARALLDAATTGQINAEDDTGSVSVGPFGINLTNRTFNTDGPFNVKEDESKYWSLDINPVLRTGSFSKGDFSIGGTLGDSKSGFIRKGPLRLDAGYGIVEPYTPPERVAPIGTYQVTPGVNEPWAKLSVNLGEQERRDMMIPDSAIQRTVGTAIKRDLPADLQPVKVSAPQTAQEYATEFLKDYASKNENWWRP